MDWGNFSESSYIVANPTETTFHVWLPAQNEHKLLLDLAKWLSNHNFAVQPNQLMLVAIRNQLRFEAIGFEEEHFTRVRLAGGQSKEFEDFLHKRAKRGVIGTQHHGKEKFALKGLRISTHVTTGIHISDLTEFCPDTSTLYEFKKGSQIIGRAFATNYESEMAENAPSIQLFEVKAGYRRKGMGSRLLRVIETKLQTQGFDRVWAEDTRGKGSFEFWKRNGYQETDELEEDVFKVLTV